MTKNSDDGCKRERTYSITELCNEFGLTTRGLRFYEQKKLLTPSRRGWTRIFSHRDRARLKLIVRGKRARFTLSEIKEMLDLYEKDDGELTQLQASLPKLKGQLKMLQAHRTELTAAIEDLERTCTLVDKKLHERVVAQAIPTEHQLAPATYIL